MPQNPEPWNSWQLDVNFLNDLDRWAAQNPENTLHKLLQKMSDTIDHGEDFLNVIPSGVFPARELVTGLVCLIKLGKTIAFAKLDIHAFVMEIAGWVDRIQRAFSMGQKKLLKRHFTETTWANLEEIRGIIVEICQWAADHLSERRWSLRAIIEKSFTQSVVDLFKKRIEAARKIFHDEAIINQSRSIDLILHYLGYIRKDQRRILAKLRGIKVAQKNEFDLIMAKFAEAEERADAENDERRQAALAEDRRKTVERMLSRHAVEEPTYLTQGKLPCSEGTREAVLQDIENWVKDVTPRSPNFCWLSGEPGCGKSAITASLAKSCEANTTLWCQLFINRNNTDTTDPNVYFPTIARQIARRSPVVQSALHEVLTSTGTGVLSAGISPSQATGLFVDAIRLICQSDTKKPVVIIIDGLDETDRVHLRKTAIIFSQLFDAFQGCPNAKIFIASRTDDEISSSFAQKQCVKYLHLDTKASFGDVASFLRKELAHIVIDHDLDWETWPGDEGSKMLAEHASGLFIWAVTVVGFFRDQILLRGTEILPGLLKDIHSKGSRGINALYRYILFETYKQACDTGDSEWVFETFRRLVGAIVVLCDPVSLNTLRAILDLRQTPSHPLVDVVQFVKRLRTVLVAGTETVQGRTVPRVHRSFFEYITSDNAAEDFRVQPGMTETETFKTTFLAPKVSFRVDVAASHRELAVRCLYQVPNARSAISSFKIPNAVRYAIRFWSQHLSQGFASTSGILFPSTIPDISDVERLLQYPSTTPGIPPISLTASSSSIVTSVLGETCAWDISDGLVENGISLVEAVAINLPPQSPDGLSPSHTAWHPQPAVVGTLFSDDTNIGWALPNKAGWWDPLTQLKGDIKLEKPATWSSVSGTTLEGGYFAKARDGIIRIWNLHAKKQKPTLVTTIKLLENAATVGKDISCLSLSSEGAILAAGCMDGSLHFWNGRDGKYIPNIPQKTPPTLGDKPIKIVTLSTDGKRALSCWDQCMDIVMWALGDGSFHAQRVFKFEAKADCGVPRSVAFSPDGSFFSSCHSHGTIYVWDIRTGGETELSPLYSSSIHDEDTTFIRYSTDGESIISGTRDGRLDIWDVESRRKLASVAGKNEHLTGINACFVHQGNLPPRVLYATASEMKLLKVQGKHTDVELVMRDRAPGLTCFSPNGKHVHITPTSSGLVVYIQSATSQEVEELSLKGILASAHPSTFAISSDGSRLSGLSHEGVLYVWDMMDGNLAIKPSKLEDLASLPATSNNPSMHFTPEGKLVISNGTISCWEVSNGELTRVALPPPISTSPPHFFDTENNTSNSKSSHGLRWIPLNLTGSNSGLWAFIGDCFIRAQKGGPLIISPLGDLHRVGEPSIAAKPTREVSKPNRSMTT